MKSAVFALLMNVSTAANVGTNCECVTLPDPHPWASGNAGKVNAETTAAKAADGDDAAVEQVLTEYPEAYGFGSCSAHDAGKAPSCSVDSPPSWCASEWCFVNPACDNDDTKLSSYFPSTDDNVSPSFSYAACGAVDSYSEADDRNGE